ncbi:phosphatase PAP2 family protein [Roseicella aquatilis]|uniref:Phosphatase PAP2 family protein n=1 Tax=Roseicella aquatilis TaxID=2527868 RepID=A0A4R4DIH9_9PROT|nr:phosphatase PAP2 family protein [Roseicella aquatilis]TCZ60925.1 phosphatase PAP2 family protein [Roseicella aquatilis]
MIFLTDFADLGLVLPLAGMVALALVALGRGRDALAWSAAVAGTLGATLLLKLAVFVWTGHHGGPGLASPSGHAAAGAVVYAGLLVLLGARLAPRLPLALLAGAGFGLLFGGTRIALEVHSLEDVLAGTAVGAAGTLCLAWLAGPARPAAPARSRAVLAVVALIGMLAFHGHRLPAEQEIRAIAAELRTGLPL